MTELKTRPNCKDVEAYIASIDSSSKRADSEILLKLFSKVTGYKAVMWGESIVGFGRYSYTNTAGTSDWLMTGFSPRSRNLTLYVMQGFTGFQDEVAALGKVKHSKSCLYMNKLQDVDMDKLEQFLKSVVADMKTKYVCSDITLT